VRPDWVCRIGEVGGAAVRVGLSVRAGEVPARLVGDRGDLCMDRNVSHGLRCPGGGPACR